MTAHIRCLIRWAWRNSLRLRVPTCWQRCPMPRILKEPEGCEFSIFRNTVVPTCLDMLMLSSSGVLTWKCLAMVHPISLKWQNVRHVESWAGQKRKHFPRFLPDCVPYMLSGTSKCSWNQEWAVIMAVGRGLFLKCTYYILLTTC